MRKRELDRLEIALREKREVIAHEIERLRKGNLDTNLKEATGDLSSYSHHMADMGTDMGEREKDFLIVSQQNRFIQHIDEAIRRIQAGAYGDCQQCGTHIGYERLLAVPHARFCIDCKSAEERAKNGRASE